MFKIYFNKSLVQDYPRVPFLTPILGIYKYKWNFDWEYLYYDEDQLNEREIEWKKTIKYENINKCDFCVFPRNFKIEFFPILKKEALKAKSYNKRIIVFYETDIETPIPYIDNIIVFRTSLTSESPKYELGLPTFVKPLNIDDNNNKNIQKISIWYVWYWWSIPLKLTIRDKIRKLKIIYWVYNKLIYFNIILALFPFKHLNLNKNSYPFKLTYITFTLFQYGKWLIVRSKVIKHLKSSKYIFNRISRDKILNPKVIWSLRNDYIENVKNSTFIMIARGHWNHAYRLYESMSAWRIPLFIDTNCRLPLEDIIEYKNLFVWVPFKDIHMIETYIDSYISKNGKMLDKIEEEIKKIYKHNLTMNGFFQTILKQWYIITK